MSPFKSLFAAVLVMTVPLAACSKEPAPLDAQQKQQMEQLVHEYLVNNPEVVIEAIKEFQRREQVASKAKQQNAMATFSDDLKGSPNDPIMGNVNGDVTMVEFFDYRCGYCKKVFPDVQKLLKTDGNIRLVLKEFPILGPESVYASRVAQAVWLHQKDKYQAFHTAMMLNKGGLGEETVQKLASHSGVDTKALAEQMNDPLVDATLEATAKQAQAMDITGTPAFIIGNTLAPGAISLASMIDMVVAARKKAQGK